MAVFEFCKSYYGFCKNCERMVKLSYKNTCKNCGAEPLSGSMVTDVSWNKKTEDEKEAFAKEIAETLENKLEKQALLKDLEEKAEEKKAFDLNQKVGPFKGQYLVYSIDGVRGRHIDVYEDKVVIKTKVTIGSIITKNATDGEKTIYYSDCIGIQFKPAKWTIGYLQLETAASSGNNQHSNFFNENSFTFDQNVISNSKMEEIADYVKNQIDKIKKEKSQFASAQNNTSTPLIADELLKLKQLLDMGILTQEEFDAKKKQLLGL